MAVFGLDRRLFMCLPLYLQPCNDYSVELVAGRYDVSSQ